jgi:predicted nucleic acid-binding protein
VTLYLDTSDLIKLYIEEAGSDRIQRLVSEADFVATSALAYAEARATIARRRRERLMTRSASSDVIAQLDTDWPRFVVMPFSDELSREAGRLADAHALRGGDAVHLASFAVLLARSADNDVRFSSADDRLSRAARALG